MAGKGYQYSFSKQAPVILDPAGRKLKADKVAAVILDYAGNDPAQYTCLDIGCAAGSFSQFLSPLFRRVIAFDIDREAISQAQKQHAGYNILYLLADSMRIPLQDGSIDVVICNHVYEHVPSAQRLLDEIHRVLKEDGFCYFTAATWFIIREPHYNLYFLSWLPRFLSNLYVRVTGKAEVYYEELLNLRQLKRLVSRFSVEDYTLKIITQPKRFHAEDVIPEKSLLTRLPLTLLRHLYFFIPTYVWILTKRKPKGEPIGERN